MYEVCGSVFNYRDFALCLYLQLWICSYENKGHSAEKGKYSEAKRPVDKARFNTGVNLWLDFTFVLAGNTFHEQ